MLQLSYCCQTHVCVPDVSCSQINQNVRVRAETVYLRAKQGEWAAHAQKAALPDEFRRRVFKGTFGERVAGSVTFFWSGCGEVTRWSSRNLNHLPSGSNHIGIQCLCSSSSWVGALVLLKELKDLYQIAMCTAPPPRRNQDSAPSLCYYFLTAFTLFPYAFRSLVKNCLNLPFGTQGRSRRLKAFFLQTRNGEHRKALVPERAPQGSAQFQYILLLHIFCIHDKPQIKSCCFCSKQ